MDKEDAPKFKPEYKLGTTTYERPKRTNDSMIKRAEKKEINMLSETKIRRNIETIEQKIRRLKNIIHAIKRQTELVELLEDKLQSGEIKKTDKFGAELTDGFSFFESNFNIHVGTLISLLKDNIEGNTTTASELVAELGIEVK
ncbi:DUF1359 domain-containing protein [Lactococcus lactis]|uniref:DUF1359 domain-containing protein n=1 Tax=Lactococcus lactis TaxID=1358 RepID=UPI003D128F8D